MKEVSVDGPSDQNNGGVDDDVDVDVDSHTVQSWEDISSLPREEDINTDREERQGRAGNSPRVECKDYPEPATTTSGTTRITTYERHDTTERTHDDR